MVRKLAVPEWHHGSLTIHVYTAGIQIAGARAMRQDENFRECPSCQAGNV